MHVAFIDEETCTLTGLHPAAHLRAALRQVHRQVQAHRLAPAVRHQAAPQVPQATAHRHLQARRRRVHHPQRHV
jgi:hypothetical protein